jgi:opacity protein-like surface antigen
MSTTSKALAAIAIMATIVTPARAADVYGGESYKDGPGPEYRQPGHGGFYISGTLGYAWTDREYSRTIDREVGVDVKLPTKNVTQEDIDHVADELTKAGVAHRGNLVPGGNLIIPLLGDILKFGTDDDANGFTYGAGVQYLFHNGGRYGVSIGADVEGYGNGESKYKHTDLAGKISGGNLLGDHGGCGGPGTGCAGEDSPFSQSGTASVDRQFDIDLVLMGHIFITDRLAVHAGGGISFARAEVCGTNKSGSTNPMLIKAFDTGFCDDDFAIGGVIKGGLQYWLAENVTIGFDATAKWHGFEASGDSYNSVNLDRAGDIKLYGQSSDTVEADDVVVGAKGRLSVKF